MWVFCVGRNRDSMRSPAPHHAIELFRLRLA
jgi:hypothetical protein